MTGEHVLGGGGLVSVLWALDLCKSVLGPLVITMCPPVFLTSDPFHPVSEPGTTNHSAWHPLSGGPARHSAASGPAQVAGPSLLTLHVLLPVAPCGGEGWQRVRAPRPWKTRAGKGPHPVPKGHDGGAANMHS